MRTAVHSIAAGRRKDPVPCSRPGPLPSPLFQTPHPRSGAGARMRVDGHPEPMTLSGKRNIPAGDLSTRLFLETL